MKQLVEDGMKVGACLGELVMLPTARGRLHTLIRTSRPGWGFSQCFRAASWIKRNGLEDESRFSARLDYLAHLQQLLTEYAKVHPFRQPCDEADDVSLSRWEARWRRVRSRHTEPSAATHESIDYTPRSKTVA